MKIAIVAVLAALTLAACGGMNSSGVATSDASVPNVSSFYVDTIDGQRVLCVWAALGYGAGVSCDWSK